MNSYKIRKEGINRYIDSVEDIRTIEPDAIRWLKKEAAVRQCLNERSVALDLLVSYVADLRRISDQFTEFRMSYFDHEPECYDEQEVSDDERVLEKVIDILWQIREKTAHPIAIDQGCRFMTEAHENVVKAILGEGDE